MLDCFFFLKIPFCICCTRSRYSVILEKKKKKLVWFFLLKLITRNRGNIATKPTNTVIRSKNLSMG